jgi:hypothetical protein
MGTGHVARVGKSKSFWILLVKVDLTETANEDGSWMKLAQDRFQWKALV